MTKPNFNPKNIEISKTANLPTRFGNFKICVYKELINNTIKEHAAIFSTDLAKRIENNENINVRIHSECLTGDGFGSLKCDCGEQLVYALNFIAQNGGLLIYLRQEGRNIGLFNKINAYELQDQGADTIQANHQLGFGADERSYEIADFILKNFGIKNINLITNNPAKLNALKSAHIIARIPIQIKANKYDQNYLRIKKEQMGHLLD